MFFGTRFLNQWQHSAVVYPYEVEVPPAELAVSLADIKIQLRLDADDLSQDSYLTLLAKAAIAIGQEYTRRVFVNTTFKTYRNSFDSGYFVLRRSKLQSISSISYKVNGVDTPISTSVYYNTLSNDYSAIMLTDHQAWPTNSDYRYDAIKILFVAGYGPTAEYVPADIKVALLNHIALLYESRGDCECDAKTNLPATTLAIYNDYKIIDINGDLYY